MMLKKIVVVSGCMQGDFFADISAGALDTSNSGTMSPFLSVDGLVADAPLLLEYFRNGKDAKNAWETCKEKIFSGVPLAGVFLQQFMQKEGYECARIDGYSEYNKKQFEQEVADAQVLLISTTFVIKWAAILAVAEHAKKINPNIVVIAGGLGVLRAYKMKQNLEKKVLPPAIIEMHAKEKRIFISPHESEVDFAVVSIHGTNELLVLLKSLQENNDNYKQVPNIAWYDRDAKDYRMHSQEEGVVSDVSADWSQVVQPDKRAWYPVQVGQGCPFRCKFCDFHVLTPKISRAPLESVRNTIASIPVVDGVRRIYFTNDNIFPNATIGKEFLRALISWDLNVRWQAFARADTIQDEELTELMKKSGCVNVWIGMESGDDQVLKNMNKHCTAEVLRKCHQNLAKNNICQKNFIIIGFPGETEESFQNTIKVLNDIPTSDQRVAVYKEFMFLVLGISPIGTLAERANYGLKGFWDKWSHNTMSSEQAEKLVLRTALEVKPELGVAYPRDAYVDQLSLSPKMWNQFYALRRLLHFRSNKVPDNDPRTVEQLWEEMEELMKHFGEDCTSYGTEVGPQ